MAGPALKLKIRSVMILVFVLVLVSVSVSVCVFVLVLVLVFVFVFCSFSVSGIWNLESGILTFRPPYAIAKPHPPRAEPAFGALPAESRS